MFFIIILLAISLIVLFVFAFRLKAFIAVDNADISVVISYLGIIKVKRRYVIKHEEETILALYLVKKKSLKRVITLVEIIKKIIKAVPTDIALVDIITVLSQPLRGKRKKGAFSYIYKKLKYDIAIDLLVGLEDAFFTAMACGIINGAAGAVLAVYNEEEKKVRVKTYPDYSKLNFSVRLNCIIALAPADIIIGYAIYKKNKRR